VRDVPGASSDVVPVVECRVEVLVDVVIGPLDNSRFESPLAGSNEGLLVTPAFASMGLRSWRDGSIVNVCGCRLCEGCICTAECSTHLRAAPCLFVTRH
jgi:hypothetical protein